MSKEKLHNLWSARVAEFKASGETNVSAWCTAQGLKTHQMRYWLQKDLESSKPVEWLPLDIDDNTESSVTVRVGQVAVEVRPGFDPKLLLSVVKTLTALC